MERKRILGTSKKESVLKERAVTVHYLASLVCTASNVRACWHRMHLPFQVFQQNLPSGASNTEGTEIVCPLPAQVESCPRDGCSFPAFDFRNCQKNYCARTSLHPFSVSLELGQLTLYFSSTFFLQEMVGLTDCECFNHQAPNSRGDKTYNMMFYFLFSCRVSARLTGSLTSSLCE